MTEMAPLKGKLLSGERELTRAQLFENVARAAAGFSSIGIGVGDTVAIMMRNDFAFIEASIAANFAGAHAVPINWHFQAEETAYLLRDSAAKVLVIHADLISQVQAGIPDGVKVFVVPPPPEIQTAYHLSPDHCVSPQGFTLWSDWLSRQEPEELGPPPPPSSMILYIGNDRPPERCAARPLDRIVCGEACRDGCDGFRPQERRRLSHGCNWSNVSLSAKHLRAIRR